MLLEHVGLRIFLQMIHAPGAYAPGAAAAAGPLIVMVFPASLYLE